MAGVKGFTRVEMKVLWLSLLPHLSYVGNWNPAEVKAVDSLRKAGYLKIDGKRKVWGYYYKPTKKYCPLLLRHRKALAILAVCARMKEILKAKEGLEIETLRSKEC